MFEFKVKYTILLVLTQQILNFILKSVNCLDFKHCFVQNRHFIVACMLLNKEGVEQRPGQAGKITPR